jgi:Tol biopolymer transport system component
MTRPRVVALAVAVLATAAVSGCAVGFPKTTTYVSDTGATLNGTVVSSFNGDTEFWWRYGETTAYESETPHRTVSTASGQPHPVSQPLSGLTSDTTYHFQLCVQDSEEDPPREVCSEDRTFTTRPAGGRSGIAFTHFLFTPQPGGANHEIFAMDADGRHPTNLSNDPGGDYTPAWSPDSTKIAFRSFRDGVGEIHSEIYVMDADGGNPTNLTNNLSGDADPAWSPDGTKIAFTSRRDGDSEIYVMDADGSNQTNLTNDPSSDEVPAWSPDGRKIAFSSFGRDGSTKIFVMDADGGNPTNLRTPGDDYEPAWSPDGTKIAFVSFANAFGTGEIYVMDADGSNQTNLTNDPSEDASPTWSPDGTQIAFHSDREGGNTKIFVMDADGKHPTNLTDGLDQYPAWSPRP